MLNIFQRVKDVVWGVEESLATEEEKEKEKPSNESSHNDLTLTGRVTHYDKSTKTGMINHSIYFDNEAVIGGVRIKVGIEVHVCAKREHALAGWKATKVVTTNHWKPSETTNSRNIIGYINEEGRTSCIALCGEEEVVFRRDAVTQGFIPRQGDWIMLKLQDEYDEVIVSDVNCLREKSVSGTVEWFSGHHGMIEGNIGFALYACENGFVPREGDVVRVTCVECNHNRMSWRAVKVSPNNQIINESSAQIQLPSSMISEVKCGVSVVGVGDFGEVEISQTRKINLSINNQCDQSHTLYKCSPVSLQDQLRVSLRSNVNKEKPDEESGLTGINGRMKEDKQEDKIINGKEEKIQDCRDHEIILLPGSTYDVTLELEPKLLGRLATAVVFDFGEFRISRSIKARIIDPQIHLMEPSQPFIHHTQRRRSYNVKYQDRLNACTVPGQRPLRKRMVRLPHKLNHYPVPDDIRECIGLQDDVTFVRPTILEPLSFETYQEHFSTLLYCEELQMEVNIRQFDMYSALLYQCGQYLSLNVPGLAEGRPSIIVGDRVILCEPGGDERSEHYEGYIHEVRVDGVLLLFSENFHDQFHNEDYDVMFTFNRIPLRRMHQTIELISQIGNKTLFPTSPSPQPPLLRLPPALNTLFNPNLNERQQAAVARILGAQGRPSPYVIFGPPGTGKTVTLVEAILQVHLQSKGSDRVLVCAPSNSAADLIADRLLESGQLESGVLIRLNALQRVQPCSTLLLPHCIDTNEVDSAARHKIIVATCVTAGILYSLALPVGHFTRVFVDEAGQATEPECLIPIGLLAGTDRQPVLAGDPYQLGPVLQSRLALSHGLGLSMLERLMNRVVYQRDEEKFVDHGSYDPLLVTKLVINYRSHENLLALYSKMFYHNELQPGADITLTHSLCQWRSLPNPDFPLLFHGIVGDDVREGNSPSWFNPVEVVQVVRYTQLLLDGSLPLTIDDVGIITPYRKQVEKIRLLLKCTGLEDIKVGSVEEFQGQEKLAVILSTVRSSPDQLYFDLQHNLGFLSNPKRFNVSISRAQALLVVIGNPNLLSQDPHWYQLLNYAVENSAYTGCPLPSKHLDTDAD